MTGANQIPCRKKYQFSSPYGSIGSNCYNCVRSAACIIQQAAFLFRPVEMPGRGWIEFPDPSKKPCGLRLMLGPRRKRFSMFPDPDSYKERLEALGIYDKAAGADTIHALTAALTPFVEREFQGSLSPDDGPSQSHGAEQADRTVINSDENQSEQTLAECFTACSGDNIEGTEP